MTNRLPFRFLMNIKVSIHYERLQVKINTTNLDTTNHNTINGPSILKYGLFPELREVSGSEYVQYDMRNMTMTVIWKNYTFF